MKLTAEQFWELLWGGEAFKYSDWETKHASVDCIITPRRFREALAAINKHLALAAPASGMVNMGEQDPPAVQRLFTPEEVREIIRQFPTSTNPHFDWEEHWIKLANTLNAVVRFAPVPAERERLATPEESVINAAKALARAASYGAISLEQVPSELIHNLFDAVRELPEVHSELEKDK